MSADTATESKRDSAGFFSSAKSFSLPLGPRIEPEAVAGYPIDMRVKTRTPGWPPDWLPPRELQLHVDVIQWGLAAHERWLAGEGDAWLQDAIACGEHYVDIQEVGGERDGAFVHLFRYPHSLPLPPPWTSAMAQGEGASLFVRLFKATGDDRYAEAALRALEPMRVPTEQGGCRAMLDGRWFPEEYPTRPPSFVLNGGIFAIWGLRDVGVGLGDERALAEFHEASETLGANIERWDTGSWSRYDLFPHPVQNPASSFYHDLHISQLTAQDMLRPDPRLVAMRDRWKAYAESPRHERMAFVRKGIYRLAVPRNRFLAHRMPWTRRLAR